MNILPINKTYLSTRTTGSHTQQNTPSFKELLNQSTASPPKDDPFNERASLPRAQLMDILNDIRSQMNRRLIQALSSDGEKEMDHGYTILTDRFIPHGTALSKNHRPNQNNDVFKVRGDLEPIINRAAEAYGVDPALVKSVIKVESNFDPHSRSPKGAMGLMQLMPATARDLGVQNAYDPVENVWAGTRYLKGLLNRYGGNVDLALAAYNWGMGNLEKRPGQMPSETKNYIENVTRCYETAKAQTV